MIYITSISTDQSIYFCLQTNAQIVLFVLQQSQDLEHFLQESSKWYIYSLIPLSGYRLGYCLGLLF